MFPEGAKRPENAPNVIFWPFRAPLASTRGFLRAFRPRGVGVRYEVAHPKISNKMKFFEKFWGARKCSQRVPNGQKPRQNSFSDASGAGASGQARARTPPLISPSGRVTSL